MSDSDIIFEKFTDSKGNTPSVKNFTIEIYDKGENKLVSAEKKELPITLHVPTLLPDTNMQIYVKVELSNSDIVIDAEKIPVTITPNSTPNP